MIVENISEQYMWMCMIMCVQSYILYVCMCVLCTVCLCDCTNSTVVYIPFPIFGVSASICVWRSACGIFVCEVGLQVYNPVCLVEWVIYT